ncbi:alpha-2,8-sialyltransferase 8F-like [Clarias gariepinus]|uniref:alpha-2,8-sialyltransferase 8F-like n=1 Tax=Clarias gariepinus TaxID=13013 RepID=UPI00234DB42E|nr:alpha-2,8-sialyltransferase 8F-like [Clarias gariepinus]
MNAFIIRLLSILFIASFSSFLIWHCFIHRHSARKHPHNISQTPAKSRDEAATEIHNVDENPTKSKANSFIDKLLARYSTNWEKQEQNFKTYRSLLGSSCKAISNAVLTQSNSPLGSNITYDAFRKKIIQVKEDLFSVIPKENPFQTAPWDSCAVVGNGGILANSSCGKQIDSASYVIRCNLPPLNNEYERDTGSKTNLVTANPSILFQKYHALNARRRPFVDDVQLYGDALIMLPAYSYPQNTAVSFRALYSLEDHGSSGPRAVFSNPDYLTSLAKFWRSQGLRSARLSTGIMMASMALELCNNVYLYGFWPFETHPYTYQHLSNHYYDNRLANKVHAMPAEFESLLNLHNKGVINLHLGKCTN